MSTERPIANAILVNAPNAPFRRTITLLIGLNIGFGMYFMCDSAVVSGYALAYIFWAFWLPSFGYMSALDDETNGLTCFALTQCCLSLIVLCISLSIASFYMSLHDMCTDCQQQFEDQDGICYQNNSIVIEWGECLALPRADVTIATTMYTCIIALVGLLTSHQALTIIEQKKTCIVAFEDVRIVVV
jgi:hypothetical protein